MHRKLRKIGSAILVAAMLIQQCSLAGFAEEAQSQAAATEAQSQTAATEAQSQASATEAQSQAPATEAQSQAPATEAQSQTAATEAQSQAPATETQSQTAATEAQSQAPATETQSQAPATEAQSQTAATEAQSQTAATEQTTESETETEKETEKESEKEMDSQKKKKTEETERSERKNGGEKLSSDRLESLLSGVLPYLFAANTVSGPDTLLNGQKILAGEAAGAELSSLKSVSRDLANARSSSTVTVVNVYADKDGNLDLSQLTKAFGGEAVDVTGRFCVVNVIADTAGQNLSFSGYEIKSGGQPVAYTEETQPGDVIYNFAAMDQDSFTGYQGTLTLGGGNFQGTVLAPEASVKAEGSLAGAVYANAVTVGDSVQSLQRIVFGKGAESESETATEEESETESETVTEAQSESESESESETEAVTEEESETESETVTEAQSETESETVTEAQSETESETVTEAQSETESETVTEAQSETESESESELGILDAGETEENASQYADAEFTVVLKDADGQEGLDGTAEIFAASDLYSGGTLAYEKIRFWNQKPFRKAALPWEPLFAARGITAWSFPLFLRGIRGLPACILPPHRAALPFMPEMRRPGIHRKSS